MRQGGTQPPIIADYPLGTEPHTIEMTGHYRKQYNIYSNGHHWMQKHITWLRTIEFTEPMLTNVFENYFNEMIYCIGRLEALDKEVELLAKSKEYKEIVGLLRCFHGIDSLTALTTLTEIYPSG